MKRIIALTVLSFVAFVAGFAPISDAHADPTGNTFRVTVKPALGQPSLTATVSMFQSPGA
jgi:hypothetical protein